jgi:hypothetical protein
MPQHLVERMTLGLIVEWRRLTGLWAGERWTAAGVLAGPPAVEPWAILAEAPGWRRYYAGTATVELFAGNTAGYRDNLASSRPALYAILRRQRRAPGISIHALTVDPGEIEVHADAGDDLIEAVPMPEFLAAWIEGFVARHHVERPVYRRQRDRPDLEALGRRAPRQGAPR